MMNELNISNSLLGIIYYFIYHHYWYLFNQFSLCGYKSLNFNCNNLPLNSWVRHEGNIRLHLVYIDLCYVINILQPNTIFVVGCKLWLLKWLKNNLTMSQEYFFSPCISKCFIIAARELIHFEHSWHWYWSGVAIN